MTDWLNPPYYTVPDPNPEFYMTPQGTVDVRFDVEYGMGLAIDSDLKNPNHYFSNATSLDPQYHDPIAYTKNLVTKAQNLAMGPDSIKYYRPDGWSPMLATIKYANIVFQLLKQIPCNRGDEASNNLLDSWMAGTGQNYGGHPNTAPAEDPMHAATGQSVAPEGTIL